MPDGSPHFAVRERVWARRTVRERVRGQETVARPAQTASFVTFVCRLGGVCHRSLRFSGFFDTTLWRRSSDVTERCVFRAFGRQTPSARQSVVENRTVVRRRAARRPLPQHPGPAQPTQADTPRAPWCLPKVRVFSNVMDCCRMHRRVAGLFLAVLFLGSLMGGPTGSALPKSTDLVFPEASASSLFAALVPASLHPDALASRESTEGHGHRQHHPHHAPPAQDGAVGSSAHEDHAHPNEGHHHEDADPHCQIVCATTSVFDPTPLVAVTEVVSAAGFRVSFQRPSEADRVVASVAHPFLLPFGQAPPRPVL